MEAETSCSLCVLLCKKPHRQGQQALSLLAVQSEYLGTKRHFLCCPTSMCGRMPAVPRSSEDLPTP